MALPLHEPGHTMLPAKEHSKAWRLSFHPCIGLYLLWFALRYGDMLASERNTYGWEAGIVTSTCLNSHFVIFFPLKLSLCWRVQLLRVAGDCPDEVAMQL